MGNMPLEFVQTCVHSYSHPYIYPNIHQLFITGIHPSIQSMHPSFHPLPFWLKQPVLLKTSAPCGYLTPDLLGQNAGVSAGKRIGVRFSRFEGRCFCFVHPVGHERAVLQQRMHYEQLDPLAGKYVSRVE